MAASEPTSTVAVGGFELVVGSPAGTLISKGPSDDVDERLARALEAERHPSSPGTIAGNVVDTASEVTARIEDAGNLFAALADGSILTPDPERVDVMLEMLQRLVGEGRWEEALRLARAMNGLLALIRRWAELARSLAVALRSAEQLGNSSAIAWAQHELGTLHLAAGDQAGAERRLAEAQQIRRRLGEREGLAATEHNLGTLCQQLRESLREGDRQPREARTRRWLAIALAAAVLLLLIGGVAGAMIARSDDPPNTPTLTAKLTVHVSGTGTVTSSPAGIRCKDDCDAEFDRGRRVSLTASASRGFRFVEWDGDCEGTRACRLTLEHAQTVRARFAPTPESRTLHVKKAGAGSGRVKSRPSGIDCGTACTTSVKRGSQIELTAAALDDATFAGWQGGGCEGTGSCTVGMDHDVTVTARFIVPSVSFRLAVNTAGKGSGHVTSKPKGISCNRDCDELFAKDTKVNLSATADDDSEFAGWDGADCTGSVALTCTVTMSEAKSVTATFDPKPAARFTLTITTEEEGTVAADPPCPDTGACTYAPDEQVTLTATPGGGNNQVSWTGCDEPPTGNACVVTMSGDRQVSATFSLFNEP